MMAHDSTSGRASGAAVSIQPRGESPPQQGPREQRPHSRPAVPPAGAGGTKSGSSPAVLDDAWAQLWFSGQRYVWSTLVVVPADTIEGAAGAARSLAAAGRLYRDGPVEMLDATGAKPADIPAIISAAADAASHGAQVVIVVDSPLANPAAIAIARSADAALLAVPLGGARLSRARRTIDTVGRERFIGSVAIHHRARPARGQRP